MTENELKNLLAAVTPPDEAARAAAHAHWAALAKPLGGLGRLEGMVEDAAALTGDGRMWIAAGTAVALTVGAIVAGSIAPLREARHAARDFPHTPEYEAYARRRAANEADDRHRIELK